MVRFLTRAAALRHVVVSGTIAALLVLAPHPAAAKVALMTLRELVQDAEFIGLVRVDRVRGIPFLRAPRATAGVLEQWKGAPTDRVRFVAAPDWTCDISGAVGGETAVVFIRQGRLAHSGRGRMPIFTREGRRLAEIWPDVGLPAGLTRGPGPDGPTSTFTAGVPVDELRDAVSDAVDRGLVVPAGGVSIHRHAPTALAP